MRTSTSSPLITIVVPTRDRPELATLALRALRKQSFQDFEVILSDNAVRRPFVPDPAVFDGERVRYIRPPTAMWMTDHWEFAVSQARGRYVGVLGDKSALVPSALEQVAAEIRKDAPDAVTWRIAAFQPDGKSLAGPGVVAVVPAPNPEPIKLSATDVLEYQLGVYLGGVSAPDTHLEIRGSIYHGVFSATLLKAMRSRFGRVFRFYAPDLNAQCAAMQIVQEITHIRRPLEVRIEGPSNGMAIGGRVSQLLSTQEEATRGASGASPKLIPNISASVSHLLASDLAAVAGRTLSREQWYELHARTAFDMYRSSDWPDRPFKESQLEALARSAQRFGPGLEERLHDEKWNGRRSRVRSIVSRQLRVRFGRRIDGLKRILRQENTSLERRSFEHLFAALDATA